MKALLNEYTEKYYKAMDDSIPGLIRRETRKIVSRNSVADNIKFS